MLVPLAQLVLLAGLAASAYEIPRFILRHKILLTCTNQAGRTKQPSEQARQASEHMALG